ncbi:hypothetical protein EDB86DRAFT_2825134 [Lactarius hatsudake]|nr:hypothetical protein EDB86DRAFT_2825134 [Lactarius hatsudake]
MGRLTHDHTPAAGKQGVLDVSRQSPCIDGGPWAMKMKAVQHEGMPHSRSNASVTSYTATVTAAITRLRPPGYRAGHLEEIWGAGSLELPSQSFASAGMSMMIEAWGVALGDALRIDRVPEGDRRRPVRTERTVFNFYIMCEAGNGEGASRTLRGYFRDRVGRFWDEQSEQSVPARLGEKAREKVVDDTGAINLRGTLTKVASEPRAGRGGWPGASCRVLASTGTGTGSNTPSCLLQPGVTLNQGVALTFSSELEYPPKMMKGFGDVVSRNPRRFKKHIYVGIW